MPELVSVLINTHERAEAVVRCLSSVLEQDYPHQFMEVLVLDDASMDGTSAVLEAQGRQFIGSAFRGFRSFRNSVSRNIIYGRHFLRGQASADSGLLVFIDDDALLAKDVISGLVSFFEETQSAGIAAPAVYYLSEPMKKAHGASFMHPWTGRYSEVFPEVSLECDWVNSTCLAARRETILAQDDSVVGFFTSHEEADLCLHAKKDGWKVFYLPGLRVLHDIKPGCAPKRERLYYLYRNKFLIIRRNFSGLRRLTALSVGLILGLPRYLAESLMFNRGLNLPELRIVVRAVLDGLRGRSGRLEDIQGF